MFESAYEYVSSRLVKTPPTSARSELTTFIEKDIISTPLWGEYTFRNGALWTDELDRSAHRYFHSWNFMTGWIALAAEDREARCVVAATAKLWLENFSSMAPEDPVYVFAYHDETTAQRARNMLRLHSVLITHSEDFQDILTRLQKHISKTGSLLATDAFYSGLNNHGMLQSLALRDVASYGEWFPTDDRESYARLATKRLAEYFNLAFTDEGVHVEHSPTYHLMVVRDMAEHSQFLETVGDDYSKVLRAMVTKAIEHATHTILPSGVFFPLSDTQQVPLTAINDGSSAGEEFEYAASGGKQGQQPESRTLNEPQSGFFVHRSSWDSEEARFLAFTAAYNADYHKHSDDLQVYLWGRGYELLGEAGPYGYGTGDPLVKYGFSQWAHNNVVVDGKSLPRTDQKHEAVGITSIKREGLTWSVRGYNHRFEDVQHERQVLVDDGVSKLRIVDELISSNDHAYTLNWNLGPEVEPTIHDQAVIGRIDGTIVFILRIESNVPVALEHHRGVSGRRPLGWKFPKMNVRTPTSLLSITGKGDNVTFVTSVEIVQSIGESSDSVLFSTSTDTPGLEEVTREPILPIISGTSIRLRTLDSLVERAVVKLFSSQGEVGTLSGQLANVRWESLPAGRYRLRIYPKHESISYAPYTTEWFELR